MIAIETFDPVHAAQIALQPMQAGEAMAGGVYADGGPAWTVRDRAGRIIACMGFVMADPGYAIAWALLAEGKGPALIAITRAARAVLDGAGWRRVELHTRADFEAAMTWAEMLGFAVESVKRRAARDGGDVLVWARIANDLRANARGEKD